jgi:hypothetical protein
MESVISRSSEYAGASDIWVDCELSWDGPVLSSHGDGEPLWVSVSVVGEEEQGEKNDLGSAASGVSSESESAGVMVGGAG